MIAPHTAAYRYRLTRDIGAPWARPRLLWIMLNPSTADESVDDPTIRKCVGFAKRLNFASLEVVNLFAFRSTKPRGLIDQRDPVGRDNDRHITDALFAATRVFAAWGGYEWHGVDRRVREVLDLIEASGRELSDVECLGTTLSGRPRHPLFVSYDTKPVPFSSSGVPR